MSACCHDLITPYVRAKGKQEHNRNKCHWVSKHTHRLLVCVSYVCTSACVFIIQDVFMLQCRVHWIDIDGKFVFHTTQTGDCPIECEVTCITSECQHKSVCIVAYILIIWWLFLFICISAKFIETMTSNIDTCNLCAFVFENVPSQHVSDEKWKFQNYQ